MASYFREKMRAVRDKDGSRRSMRGGKKGRSKGSKKNLVGNARNRESGVPGSSYVSEAEEKVDSLRHLSTKNGSVFDYYRVEEELGQGAFARVYRGIQKNSGKEVALKIVSLKGISQKAVLEHEARVEQLRLQGRHQRVEKSNTEVGDEAAQRVVDIMESEIEVMKRIRKIPLRKKKNIMDLKDVFVSCFLFFYIFFGFVVFASLALT